MAAMFSSNTSAAAEAPAALDDCNVAFETPSANAAGAVPVGNGELGASVWIEPGGDLVFYLVRTDSYSEICRLLKIGKVRVTFQPALPTAFGGFYQELKLRQGRLEVDAGNTHLEVFVEPDRPVVRVAARSTEAFSTRVAYEGWRRERRNLTGTTELIDVGWTMYGIPGDVQAVESGDVLLAPERSPAALVFYHHNAESVVPWTLKIQSCDDFPNPFDPLLHRTFGAWIEGPGLRREGAEALVSTAPANMLDLRIACPSLVAPEVGKWLALAGKHAAEAPAPEVARATTEAWWQQIWARSWVFVDEQPTASGKPPPLHLGSDANGSNRLAGAFGRVGVYNRALHPAEVVRLAAGGSNSEATVSDGRLGSANNPLPGLTLPDAAGLEPAHGFTLEAWVKPDGVAAGRIIERAGTGTGGIVFDTPSGRDLRLVVGKSALSPPALASMSTASASHVCNSFAALNNLDAIGNSQDLSVERFTWWDHRGTHEWVQYDFQEAATVDGCEVYWFDDSPGGGACRVPKTWSILYRDRDGQWRPVSGAGTSGTQRDTYNAVAFQPVLTHSLRLDVQLQDGFSGGILEWRVKEATAKPILMPGVWQHVAATCSAQGTLTLYHNGRMVAHRVPRRATPVSQAYALQRYMNACQGRGDAPIRFNGGMFTVEPKFDDPKQTLSPDWRLWGDGYWYQNTRHMYHSMLACGDADMMTPFFALYRNVLPLSQARAKSWYGAEGVYFPEIMSLFGAFPNGVYGTNRNGLRKGDVCSPAIAYTWNQGPELVMLMLDFWDYTADTRFLKEELLPMAEAVLRYFDTRFRKENGRMVIDPTQAVETYRTGVLDDMPSVAGLCAITSRLCALPAALTTAPAREFFARMRDACPAVPTEDRPVPNGKLRTLAPARTFKDMHHNCENADLYAVWPFRLYGVGRPDLELARNAYQTRRYSVHNGWGYDGNAAALLGLADESARSLLGKCGNSNPAHRFPATWGPNFDWLPDQNHGGNLMTMTHLMLLQTVDRKILLLPAWPQGWDVSFRLHAPDRTVVEGRVQGNKLTRLVVEPASRRADIEICAPFTEGSLQTGDADKNP
jgi:hypothetical protein